MAARNAFALLNDDAEDAGFDSVNTAALRPVLAAKPAVAAAQAAAPAAAASTDKKGDQHPPRRAGAPAGNRKDDKGAGPRVQRGDGPNQGGTGGGSGPRRNQGPRRAPTGDAGVTSSAGGEEGGASSTIMLDAEGKPVRPARHSDRRDRPDRGQLPRKNDNERKSHTGRGREIKKAGAGGRYTMGNERADAATGEQAANQAFTDGAAEQVAIENVHRLEAGGGVEPQTEQDTEGAAAAITVGAESAGGEDADAAAKAAADASQDKLDDKPRFMTLEEALAQKKSLKPDLSGLVKAEARKPNEGEDIKAMKKFQKQDVDFIFVEGASNVSKKAPAAAIKKPGVPAANGIGQDLAQQLFRAPQQARGGMDRRPRGDSDRPRRSAPGAGPSGSVGRSHRAAGVSAPNMDDPSAFPTLGA